MPVNKNALIRYKRIDQCLRNTNRKWTLEDLVEECSEALYEYEGVRRGVSVRSVQGDIQMMRSEMGYNAPIEVYNHKYYRYSNSDYTITKLPISQNDLDTMKEAVNVLRQFDRFDHFTQLSDVVCRLQENLSAAQGSKAIVDFDKNCDTRGLRFLSGLYNCIRNRTVVTVKYKPYMSRAVQNYTVHPHMLKEYRNKWYLLATTNWNRRVISLELDRMEKIDEEAHIPYRDNREFNTEEYFENIIGISKVGCVEMVEFKVSRDIVGDVVMNPIHVSQNIKEKLDDGSVIFEMEIEPNNEFYQLMMSFSDKVKILSPQSVVDEMRRKLSVALSQY